MYYFLSALQIQMWLPYVINLNLGIFQIRCLEAWRDRDNEKNFGGGGGAVSTEGLYVQMQTIILKRRLHTRGFKVLFSLPPQILEPNSFRQKIKSSKHLLGYNSQGQANGKPHKGKGPVLPLCQAPIENTDSRVGSWNEGGWEIRGARERSASPRAKPTTEHCSIPPEEHSQYLLKLDA